MLALRGGGDGVEVCKTFLPQKSLGFGLWKEGFETWHIALFLVGLVFGNAALVMSGIMAKPTPGVLTLDKLLNPSESSIFKTFLITTVALFAKTHAMAWAQVWMGCKNNSFSKNPWDMNTGSRKAAPITTEDDLFKKTLHNIHGNDLENIPLTLTLHTLLVLVQPTAPVANLIMITYTVSRYLHTFWYSFYGSHEIRAMIFSIGCWANYAAAAQLLAACGAL